MAVEIFLSGFGTFSIVKGKARTGRNPKTGEAIKIAARVIPKFKPAKAFKEAVQVDYGVLLFTSWRSILTYRPEMTSSLWKY
jgi:hypothetical protein